jgi:tetratricopeptide (TPR) repeat protein
LQVSLQLMRGDVEAALALVPNTHGPLRGALLYLMREYEQACEILANHLDDALVRLLYGACRLFQGDVNGARADFTTVYRAEIDLRQTAQPNVRHCALAFLIYADALCGDAGAARRGILDLARLGRERYVSPMARAIAHAGLGERDAAISSVEEAVARLDPWSAHIAVDPFLDSIRNDARFMRLEKLVAGARAA